MKERTSEFRARSKFLNETDSRLQHFVENKLVDEGRIHENRRFNCGVSTTATRFARRRLFSGNGTTK